MKEQLKREIFSVFENARVLFNDYYNGKENFSKEDLEKLDDIMYDLKQEIKEIQYNIDILESEIDE